MHFSIYFKTQQKLFVFFRPGRTSRFSRRSFARPSHRTGSKPCPLAQQAASSCARRGYVAATDIFDLLNRADSADEQTIQSLRNLKEQVNILLTGSFVSYCFLNLFFRN